MGITETPQAIYQKRKQMLKKHQDMMDNTVHAFVQQQVNKASAERYVHETSGHGIQIDVVMSNLGPIMSPSPVSNMSGQDALMIEDRLCVLTNGAGCSMPINTANVSVPTSPPSSGSIFSTPATPYLSCGSQSGLRTTPEKLTAQQSTLAQEVLRTGDDHKSDLFPELPVLAFNTSPKTADSLADQRQTLQCQTEVLKAIRRKPVTSIEALGDNLDIMKRPSSMTVERQRESWHWFLLLISQKRITNPELPNDVPKADINTMETSAWLPTPAELTNYKQNVDFHVARILVKYFSFLKQYASCVPEYIPHPHVEDSSKKSEVIDAELIDAPENSMDGIITIIKRLNHILVPRIGGDKPQVVERVVLGGDVLTNERAFSGQSALLNADNESDSCGGIIHRPEGLHRLMNFLMVTTLLLRSNCSPGLQFSCCCSSAVVSNCSPWMPNAAVVLLLLLLLPTPGCGIGILGLFVLVTSMRFSLMYVSPLTIYL